MATGGVMTPGVNPEVYTTRRRSSGRSLKDTVFTRLRKPCARPEGILNAVRGGIIQLNGIFMDEACVGDGRAGTYLVPTVAASRTSVSTDKVPAYVIEKTMRVEHTSARSNVLRSGWKIAMGTDAGTPFNRTEIMHIDLRYMVQYSTITDGRDCVLDVECGGFNAVKRRDESRMLREPICWPWVQPAEYRVCVGRANLKFIILRRDYRLVPHLSVFR